jgi:hypothetical protein
MEARVRGLGVLLLVLADEVDLLWSFLSDLAYVIMLLLTKILFRLLLRGVILFKIWETLWLVCDLAFCSVLAIMGDVYCMFLANIVGVAWNCSATSNYGACPCHIL